MLSRYKSNLKKDADIRMKSTMKSDLSHLNQYSGERSVLASKLSNSVFERILNDNGLSSEIKELLVVHVQNKENRMGTLLRKLKIDVFRKLCNEWRKTEMDLMGVPKNLQEDMFNSRWKI